MTRYAGESWDIFTAPDVSQALATMQQQRIDLLVIDIHMPVVDGLQFLNLLKRKYPNVLKVILTGDTSENCRAACLSNGAELFLEKPVDEKGWKEIYATLDELAKFQSEEGFRGVLRRVGLQDVLQMECLGRSSVILSIQAGEHQGQVFVKGGEIIHAQSGEKTGEAAFNELMGLTGGEFDLQPFSEPAARTIEGQWEFLLMEAARKRDEATESEVAIAETAPPAAIPDMFVSTRRTDAPSEGARSFDSVLPRDLFTGANPGPAVATETGTPAASPEVAPPRVEEMLICSLQGEVLHDWQCPNTSGRVGFLEFLSQKGRQLAQGLPLGEFDRLEVNGDQERVIARIQPEWALFARIQRDGGTADGDSPAA
jgi:CheY-like chemotaxis protein